ncbi:LuxR C-terminal-related transcriptional regulator [Idiomarina sp. HP20-50]|uniref:LuxR C-terminal-related transcriptional regulator n=1 Tax=Idiomarina sp. HP20-50 TaxID=3070813 RepID=UPI00294AD807|nr:LuxR C-terminal-related transcriptional regulator [Idiomarina sp. HP20-50]MDV6315165.1 LuxR C-terminal-related transcriptional regulator [Idiomarina sp. HP20-50]
MNRIILGIPNPIISAGMASVLQHHFSDQILTVSGIADLRRACYEHEDAVVVLCSQLGGAATVEHWRRLKRRYCDLKLIVWGSNQQDILDFQCGISVVDGYLLDSCDSSDLVQAIRSLKRGNVYVAASVAAYLAQNPRSQQQKTMVDMLSERELQVAQMLSRGIRVREIARHLCISSKTINTFRYRIFSKLGIDGDVQLSHLAIQSGLVDLIQFEGR